MSEQASPITCTADIEIAQKLRVKIKTGTTSEPPEVDIAGAGVRGIGTNEMLVAADKVASINTYNKSGSLEMVANGVVGVGAVVYAAAGGKIGTTAAGDPIGFALQAATADGDIIEILPFSDVDTQNVNISGGTTIATTGATSEYAIAPKTGVLAGALFSGIDALAQSDTNYITFSIVNLGQAGAGSTAMLAVDDLNTTKTTGGVAIVANGKFLLILHGTAANLTVVEGDRLQVIATATGTLANTVTGPVYSLTFSE